MPSRRSFVSKLTGAAAGSLLVPRRAAALVTADAARPSTAHGAMAGDVTGDRAIVWSRTDRPARMVVEWSTSESFEDARRVVGPGGASRDGVHGPHRPVGPARGPDDPLPRAVPGPLRSPDLEPPGRRPLQERTARRRRGGPRGRCIRARSVARRAARLVGGHGGPGLGHRPRARRAAHVRDDAAARARPVRPLRRHDLRRQPARGRGAARRRLRLAQPRHPGEGEGGRDARRVPRQLPLQPARRERAALQRRGRPGDAVGRPRGAQQLVPERDPRGRPLHREERRAARRAREARLPRAQPDPLRRRRPRARLPAHPLRARCSTSSRSTCAASAGRTRPTASPWPGPRRRSWAARSSTG